jgi:hypothetical protein
MDSARNTRVVHRGLDNDHRDGSALAPNRARPRFGSARLSARSRTCPARDYTTRISDRLTRPDVRCVSYGGACLRLYDRVEVEVAEVSPEPSD